MKTINKDSPVPIYYQLKEIIQEMIDDEEIKPSEPIPTERELCHVNEISRMTVRMAIMALVNEGVLYREQGRGTFVADQKTKHQLSRLKGLTEDMKAMGHEVDTKILSFSIHKPHKKIANALQISEENNVIEIKRLRLVDEVPYAIETVWLDEMKCPNLTREDIEGNSLYNILDRRYSLIPQHAKQTVDPIKLSEYEKELFQLEGESLALLFNRTTYTAQNVVMEYTKGIYRIDKNKFEIYLEV